MRKGRFRFPLSVINDMTSGKRQFTHLFARFVIVRAETMWLEEVVTYDAYSELFDELWPGEVPPYYEIHVKAVPMKDSKNWRAKLPDWKLRISNFKPHCM